MHSESLAILDAKASHYVFTEAQQSARLKVLSQVMSLSIDEIIAFPVSALLGFALWSLGASGSTFDVAGRQFLHLFADFGAICMFEQLLKLMCRRDRPSWLPASKTKVYAMPFEWWSFPSGHSMRAAYTATVLIDPQRSPLLTLELISQNDLTTALLFCWAIGVAVSRVAVAKHFVSDAIIGFSLGLLIAAWGFAHFNPVGPLRLVMAVLFSAEGIVVALTERYRRMIVAWPALIAILAASWLSFGVLAFW